MIVLKVLVHVYVLHALKMEIIKDIITYNIKLLMDVVIVVINNHGILKVIVEIMVLIVKNN